MDNDRRLRELDTELEHGVLTTDQSCDEGPAHAWALPLLESLLRLEALKADSHEMSDWYIHVLEEVQETYRVKLASAAEHWSPGSAHRAALRMFAIMTKKSPTIEQE